MRDVPYAMRSGRSAAARQHYLERGADRFSVTVVVLANAPPVDEEIINHAADILRKKGEVRADYPVGYIAGVRGLNPTDGSSAAPSTCMTTASTSLRQAPRLEIFQGCSSISR
jgi:hypothetical protein